MPALVGIGLLAAAIVVIWREIRHLSLHDIVGSLNAISQTALWEGAGATVLAYAALTFYDWLGCKSVGVKLSYRRTAFVAFCSYVLSHNLGCAAISGAAVRFRLYRSWNVPAGAIARIVAFCSVTYLLGMLALVGFVLLAEPNALPVLSHLPAAVPRLLGVGCWGVLLLYLLLSKGRRVVGRGAWQLELPPLGISFAQIVVGASDMAATALIAWCVIGPLPAGAPLTFSAFLAIYLFSYTAGLVASVPGGLGVFDSAMLVALSPWLPVARIMGAILVFRLLYYIIPLLLAGLMFAGHELFLRSEQFLAGHASYFRRIRPSQVLRESEADFSVGAAAGMQVVLGVVMVVYALVVALPPFETLTKALLVQGADFLLIVAGVALIGLAVGLSQRVVLAWKVSLGVLTASLLLLVLRQASWEIFIVIAAVMLLLVPFRGCYYRRAHVLVAPLPPSILVSISLWLLGLVGVGWVAVQRHLGPIWWRAMIYDAHTAKGRWFLGISALCGLVALWWGMRRTRLHFLPWDDEAAQSYQALEGALDEVRAYKPDGMIPDEAGRAFIPFLQVEDFVIGLGAPAGAQRHRVAALWRLRDFAVQEKCHLAFIYADEDLADIYEDLGLTAGYIGPFRRVYCPIEKHWGLRDCLISGKGGGWGRTL